MKTIKPAKFFKQQGFSLIEIMIVVVILAVVASFAYPSYLNQVRKSKRSDAYVALQNIAQLQESYYARNYSYATQLGDLDYPEHSQSPEGEYNLSISETKPDGCSGDSAAPCTTFTVQAAPVAGGSQEGDSACQRLTRDNLGRKLAFDAAGEESDTCW